MPMRAFLLALAFLAAFLPAVADAKTFIVILAQTYSAPKAPLFNLFGRTVKGLNGDDRIMVFAADGPSLLATLAIPQDDPKVNNPGYRHRRLAEQFQPVAAYLNGLPSAAPEGGIPDNLFIPDTLARLARNVIPATPEESADLLLIGSWLFHDPRETKWNMGASHFPSDAHLKASRAETPYGTADAPQALAGARIHYCWPGGQARFTSQAYEQAVMRFWALWTAAQGGTAATFSYDLETCVSRFLNGEHSGQPSYTVSATSPKIEMLEVAPAIPAVAPASYAEPGTYFLSDNIAISHTPPASATGIAWVGISWRADADLDLWTRPDASSQWLYFDNVETSAGRFHKDWRQATGDTQFEYVAFGPGPIDLRKAEVAVNLYDAGNLSSGPEGVLRLHFEGKIYEARFTIPVTTGNRGAPPMSGSRWKVINLIDVVGLAPAAATEAVP